MELNTIIIDGHDIAFVTREVEYRQKVTVQIRNMKYSFKLDSSRLFTIDNRCKTYRANSGRVNDRAICQVNGDTFSSRTGLHRSGANRNAQYGPLESWISKDNDIEVSTDIPGVLDKQRQ